MDSPSLATQVGRQQALLMIESMAAMLEGKVPMARVEREVMSRILRQACELLEPGPEDAERGPVDV